ATDFNRVLYPLLNVEIASGNIRGIRFHITGTDYRSRGEFRFDYDNLKIDLKADPDKPRKKSSLKIASFLVNKMIINDSNPDANEKYHVGKVNHRRVPEDRKSTRLNSSVKISYAVFCLKKKKKIAV